MITNQSINKEKQLTETEHRHTPILRTNTQQSEIEDKNQDSQSLVRKNTTTSNQQQARKQPSITDNQKNIEKNIQEANITTRKTKPDYKIDNPTPTLDDYNFPHLPKQTEKEDDQQQQKITDNQKTQLTSDITVIPETRPEDMPDTIAIPEIDLQAMPQMKTPEILSPSVVTNNRFQTLQKTTGTTPETIDSSTPNINDVATNNELILLEQQHRKAKTLATQLHKRSFIDTGRLINATKTEKEQLLALAMYFCLGKYDPSDKYIQTYRNRTITNI